MPAAQHATEPPVTLRLACHAKVNLALAVGPPDGRGFHPISSWVVAVDLADELLIERLPEGMIASFNVQWATDAPRQSPIDWPIQKDLTVRAHRLLEQHAERPLPVKATLTKRIPVGGGLGGGSSDAAAMLRGINEMFALGLTHARLCGFAARLGSDVSFFLDADKRLGQPPRPALMTGLGQEISRVPLAGVDLILVLPPVGCPTGEVYAAYDGLKPGALKQRQVQDLILASALRGGVDSKQLFNDLTAPAEKVQPALGPIRAAAAAALGQPVHVTGSGSTMFAIAADEKDAKSMVSKLKKAKVGAVAIVAKVV
jgi:4-diphosphocytidyl-2-C-methyl-D-erythritol kinase